MVTPEAIGVSIVFGIVVCGIIAIIGVCYSLGWALARCLE